MANKYRIMIVEDEVIIAMHLEDIIQMQGHEVVAHAITGEEALEMVEEEKPELIFMDVMLAGEIDGIETTKRIKAKHDIPVVYLTSNTDDGTVSRAKETNPSGFLTKPFDEAGIKTTIQIAINKFREGKGIREEKVQLEIKSEVQEASIDALTLANQKLTAALERERELMRNLEEAKAEIEAQNFKISESIDYAQKIQFAIVPHPDEVTKHLPNHFVFYRPKDVVSGDLPWFSQHGDYSYIAMIDCTGHGVPGALISLIGYFLMNEITKSEEGISPATVLNRMHHRVIEVLKQDGPDSETHDGMDVSLCRINKEKTELVYSGAHRPLLLMRDGELSQYKGAPFPIGGTLYKGLNKFHDEKIALRTGDKVLVFSDGFPDQFGGPKGGKYGSRRMRETFVAQSHQSMQALGAFYKQEFESWKGESRQMDDVLVIGIEF